MVNESNKIIVKVGKKSRIKFNNSKVFRAITVGELNALTDKYSDCHIVVIEGIYNDEEASVKKFVDDFKSKDEKNEILFFIPDNDDITSGIADELNYNIYLTLGDLCSSIYDTFNINVGASIEDRQRLNSADMQNELPEGITDIFGGLDDESEEELQKVIDSVEEITEPNEIVEETIEEKSEIVEVKEEALEEANTNIDSNSTSEKEDVANNINEELTVKNNTEEKSADNSEEIRQLKIQLRDAKYDYSEAVKDMRLANSKIESLEKVIKTLKSEKEAIVERFNSIVESSDILEDPISLEQYNRLNETIETSEDRIKELSTTIEGLKKNLTDKSEAITNKEAEIDELKESVKNLRNNLGIINKSIDSGEIHKEIIEEYNDKIARINKERDNLLFKINELQSNSDTLTSKLEDVSLLADNEAILRLNTFDKLKQAIDKIVELSTKLASIELEKNELSKKYEKVYNENEVNKSVASKLREDTNKLKESEETFNKQIELATKNAETEKNLLNNQIAELRTKLSVTEQQLSQKESQYLQLVTASGMDANGVSALAETNKTLEGITKTLREQLGTISKENESLKRKNAEASAALTSYKNQVNQLSTAIKDVASAGGGGAIAAGTGAAALIKPIAYTGKATIFPIFGSGSYGITTTAMSLATKLGVTSKVLYIDFDMVAPKADAWFGMMPICRNVPGININDRRMTGLGIFYEMGIQQFMMHFDNIVNKCERTKGGGIDYLSGVYYRVDTVKLFTADYSSLFNFLATKYQYMIVDLGRFGNSDINDRLIKCISDISPKSVVVTTSDRFEIRQFKIKLMEGNIDVANVAWLVNMCVSTNIDDKTKEIISPAQFSLMLQDSSLYGTREKFTRTKLNKDKLDLFINSALFSGRR